MENLYDVDDCDPLQDSTLVMNNIENVIKLEPDENNAGPSSATDSTERTMSYESTEDSTSTYDQNDATELETAKIQEGLVEEHTVTFESVNKPSHYEIDGASTVEGNTKCCQCEVNDAAESIKGRIKKLRWGIIEMRLHSVIPGDHPDTREGPPLTMDWEIITEQKIDIDGYEAKRPPRLRTLGYDLRMGSMDRLNILRRGGVKEEDISSAMESARQTRKQRLRTSESWRRQFVGIEVLQEKIMRKLAKTMNPERRTKLITRY